LRVPRLTWAAAGAAALALALGACGAPEAKQTTSTDASQSASAATMAESVSVMWNQPLYTLNNNTTYGNATANANIIYLTNDNWIYYDKDLNIVQNKSYGTYEKVSDDPLTIKMTIADTAQWSDGTPITAADVVLDWAALSANFNTVTGDDVDKLMNEDGTLKPNSGKSVYFDSNITGVNLMKEFPEISDDQKTITFKFSEPFADWEQNMTAFGAGLPAHIVGKRALGIDDPTQAKLAVEKAFQDKDLESLSKISNVWNTDWNFTSMPKDSDLVVCSGVYQISDFKENQYLTLSLNPNYKGERTAPAKTMTIRYNEDPMAAVQALQNGEVQLISPQPTADVLSALQGSSGITTITGDEGTYEHVDLMFNNGGPFDPKTYGGDADKALKVRQAFLLTIPRQTIVDNIIKPLNPNAEVRNSYNVVPGAPNYADVVAKNGMSTTYGTVDIDKAKQLLSEAGVTSPKVRILYGASNVRRQQEFKLIQESAQKAGFEVIDNGNDNWGAKMGDGTYDASIFGWQSQSTAITEPAANYVKGGLNNFAGYYNADVDKLYEELNGTVDPARQKEINEQVETDLVNDAFGVTLYQFPSVTAYDSKLSGIDPITISPTIFWNFWEWKVS
jgi:peptide/nickel transport system substrate-binding protein